MKLAFDIEEMKPGCALVAAALGADPALASEFSTEHWLLAPTPNMRVYPVTTEKLRLIVAMVNKQHGTNK